MTATCEPAVPAPYRCRPASLDDARAVHRLIGAVEADLFGRTETDADHFATVIARPGFDARRDAVTVTGADDAVVAWAWVNRRSEVHVHPAHRGRGLGTALLRWIEARARQSGTERVVQSVPDRDTAAVRLLAVHGYEPIATAWLSGIDCATVAAAPLDGIAIRAWRAGDAHAAHRVTVAAFGDWNQRPMAFGEWAAHTVERSGFDQAASMVALDGEDLVGALIAMAAPGGDGVIESLAVGHGHRRRGIARALLEHAFAAFAAAGRSRCTVWTHTDTGALSLYQRVGMGVERTATIFATRLSA